MEKHLAKFGRRTHDFYQRGVNDPLISLNGAGNESGIKLGEIRIRIDYYGLTSVH